MLDDSHFAGLLHPRTPFDLAMGKFTVSGLVARILLISGRHALCPLLFIHPNRKLPALSCARTDKVRRIRGGVSLIIVQAQSISEL